jgi:hypothetical protein
LAEDSVSRQIFFEGNDRKEEEVLKEWEVGFYSRKG